MDVNGENAAPLYKFLKKGFYGILGDNIQWNFAKFLVDKNGKTVDRYYPTTSPLTIEVTNIVSPLSILLISMTVIHIPIIRFYYPFAARCQEAVGAQLDVTSSRLL